MIYEMHVRSFTRASIVGRQASAAPSPACARRSRYLKELGVNCVELLPIYEFDEFENSRPQPDDGRDCC